MPMWSSITIAPHPFRHDVSRCSARRQVAAQRTPRPDAVAAQMQTLLHVTARKNARKPTGRRTRRIAGSRFLKSSSRKPGKRVRAVSVLSVGIRTPRAHAQSLRNAGSAESVGETFCVYVNAKHRLGTCITAASYGCETTAPRKSRSNAPGARGSL